MFSESLETIQDEMWDRYGVTMAQIKGVSKLKRISSARRFFCGKARMLGLTYYDIANMVKKDHTAVVYAVKKFKEISYVYEQNKL
jgi:chromosomal replication initiation ATPase DnaA